MVEVKKREHESTESLLRRFHRKVVASGAVLDAKKRRFYERPKSKQRKRDEAMKRSAYRKEIEQLKRLGKFEETTRDRS